MAVRHGVTDHDCLEADCSSIQHHVLALEEHWIRHHDGDHIGRFRA